MGMSLELPDAQLEAATYRPRHASHHHRAPPGPLWPFPALAGALLGLIALVIFSPGAVYLRPARAMGAVSPPPALPLAAKALTTQPQDHIRAGKPPTSKATPGPESTRVALARIQAAHRQLRVTPGDTLSGLAKAMYGAAGDWPVLYWANASALHHSTVLPTGLTLTVPQLPAHIPDAPDPPVAAQAVTTGTSTQGTGVPAQPVASGTGGGVGGAFGACVRQAENGGSYAWGTGNGGGAYQFLEPTWVAYGGSASTWGSASPAEQDRVFMNALAQGGQSNWSPYDGCSAGLSTAAATQGPPVVTTVTLMAYSHPAAHHRHRPPLRERAYQRALTRAGAWYCWGGTGPCYDCSGLVFTSYLPWLNIGRDTYSMLASGRIRPVPASQKRQGDLAFWGSGHVELVAGKHYTFGAHHSGSPVSLRRISPYYAPTAYYRVAW